MGKKIIDLYPHSTKLLKKIEIVTMFADENTKQPIGDSP